MCKLIESNLEGTPDLKLMGIFSENRAEYFEVQLACCSDSICVVPIPLDSLNNEKLAELFNHLEIETLTVSSQKLDIILSLKREKKINKIK